MGVLSTIGGRACQRLVAPAVLLASLAPAAAIAQEHVIRIEFLQTEISPSSAPLLEGAWCRNVDHIVHLKLSVTWPLESIEEELGAAKHLVFWNNESEFVFPAGSYFYLHGAYIVNGYFIARAGGTHQGVSSLGFERIDDAKVLLNPAVLEIPMKRAGCS